MNEAAPHILVVDDDTRLRQLLQRYLAENGFRVTAAADAREARERLKSLAFDLIVLDVMMPGENGTDFTRSLRADNAVPILLLTAMSEAEHRIAGLEAGADDYLAKPFEPRELVLRIRTILRRAPAPLPERPTTLAFGACRFDADREELTKDGAIARLSTAEARLLKILASRPGEAFDREELLRVLGGASTERAIDVQVTRLRRKIEPDPKFPRYLVTVRGRGYALRPD